LTIVKDIPGLASEAEVACEVVRYSRNSFRFGQWRFHVRADSCRVRGPKHVDKTDIKRHSDFLRRKLHDLLLMSQSAARFNQRDVIEFGDIPLTEGLKESIHG
jgi:hypothetical protein